MNVITGILWALAGILGLFVALLFLPVGVQVRYDDSGFRISLLAGPIRWQLLPVKSGWLHRKRTRSKPEKAPKPATKKVSAPRPAPKGGAWSGLRPYWPVLCDLLQGLRRRLLVRRLEFWVKLGGGDPCDLAVRYGRAWAACGAMEPLLKRALRIRRKDIQIVCDFTAENTEAYLRLDLVLCPARLLGLMLRQGPALLRVYQEQKTKKAV